MAGTRLFFVLTALLVLPFTAGATPAIEGTTPIDTRTVDVQVQAEQWNLTSEDWVRYEEIMAGPRGTWSPGLDPVTALGIHARDDAERTRYAKILARIEHQRLEQELAFERAYGDAFSAMYGDAITHEGTAVQASGWRWYGRLGIDDAAFRLVLGSAKRIGTPLEVFLSGASDDQAYREWAATQQIPLSLVQSRQIVLQHDRSGHLPGLYGNLGGSWIRLDPLSGAPEHE
ncbi:MAG: TIGR03759 family integrating conjugative element protein [Gammaproteobacteria bacterium]|nr:TIGR03759 family integrating conjugative element protein [Gammaproteobacteria bacterium]MCP5135401.1 TIGR03759 family integrating conjugative element protein [Gammaproteobacteria bacterium]